MQFSIVLKSTMPSLDVIWMGVYVALKPVHESFRQAACTSFKEAANFIVCNVPP